MAESRIKLIQEIHKIISRCWDIYYQINFYIWTGKIKLILEIWSMKRLTKFDKVMSKN